MSVFVDKDSKVILQGFTGQHATFHAEESMRFGTKVVGGVTPGKGGTTHLGLPVFNSVAEAVEETGATVSGIFVPPAIATDSLMEAVEAGIQIAVIIADGVPVQDMVRTKRYLAGRSTTIIGPNSPGIITPGACKVGIMPSHIYTKGRVGVVSRSGTLNYEAVSQMTALGLGQSTCVGIGGDPVNGTDFKSVLQAFENDDETDVVVMIGEIGGQQEVEAAAWASQYMAKPLVCFIAGVSAPRGRRMGHAGAVIAGDSDTATAKLDSIEELARRRRTVEQDVGHPGETATVDGDHRCGNTAGRGERRDRGRGRGQRCYQHRRHAESEGQRGRAGRYLHLLEPQIGFLLPGVEDDLWAPRTRPPRPVAGCVPWRVPITLPEGRVFKLPATAPSRRGTPRHRCRRGCAPCGAPWPRSRRASRSRCRRLR